MVIDSIGAFIKKIQITQYPAFVRTYLEFASAVQNSLTKSEIYKIDRIQKRATKMIIELGGLEYEKKLKIIWFTNLETRRKGKDLSQNFKIKKEFRRGET